MLKCDIVPANEICPVYTDTLNPIMEKAIRYYSEKEYQTDGSTKDIHYAEVYTPQGVEYYKAEPMTVDNHGYPAEAVAVNIYAGTVDIQPLLSATQVSDIESLVVIAIEG